MRNRVFAIFTLFALIGFPIFLAGQSASAASAGKVGVINIQDAILSTAQGKNAMQGLQSKFMPRQQEIRRRQQQVEQLREQLQKQMTTLSADEQRRLSRELTEKQTILRRMTEDAQSDLQYDRENIMRGIGEKMVKVIQQYAPQHGFALVLDSSQVPVYYTAEGFDITEAIVKLYNSTYPMQASSTSGTSSSKATPKKK